MSDLFNSLTTGLILPADSIKKAGQCIIIEIAEKLITVFSESEIYIDSEDPTDLKIVSRANEILHESGVLDAVIWMVEEIITNVEAPGFEDFDSDNEDDYNIISMLPEVFHDSDRELTITSWGVNQSGPGGKIPANSQYDINACLISSSKKGLNLKQMDGRDVEIQKRVCRASAFEFLIRTAIERIEKDDLKRISCHCSKGHHRSVAVAEILKYYYPNAKTIHPNIRR